MKLSNPEASSKVYWSISKSFVNDKKITTIPPLYHNGNFITDFRQKAELFNPFLQNNVLYYWTVENFQPT